MKVRYGAALAVIAAVLAPGVARASAHCETVDVPVTVPGVSRAKIHGELCMPDGPPPRAVQLLVHGGTYNHHYFDWPLRPDRYSYVRAAVRAGYATFNVDRLGVGESTRPLSAAVSGTSGADALHQVISRLRSGAIGGRAFSHVVWVGHSLGTGYGWIEASRHQDVDAFVLTGLAHAMKPSFLAAQATNFHTAALDPKFAALGLDPGYQTTVPGVRGSAFYHLPAAEPSVIALDERLKDTVATATEANEIVSHVLNPVPALAPSRAIKVPTLLVVGQYDNTLCGPPDGLECTRANLLEAEAPFYSREAALDVIAIPATGHDLQLHVTAPLTSTRMLDWLRRTVPSR